MDEERKAQLVGFIGMIAAGIAFFLFGTIMLSAYGSRIKCTEQVSAVVVKNLEVNKLRGGNKGKVHGTTYAPIFEYEYDGKEYSYISKISSNPAEYSAGERVTIRVNPNDPDEIYHKPKGAVMLMSILFRLIGGGLAAGGIIALIVKKTKSKPPKQTL